MWEREEEIEKQGWKRGRGCRERHTVSPGALAGSMKSLRPESEFCACPSPLPNQHVHLVHGWFRPVSNRASRDKPLQLQLTATIWGYEPSPARSAEPSGKARKYVKALLRPNEWYLWARSTPLAVR